MARGPLVLGTVWTTIASGLLVGGQTTPSKRGDPLPGLTPSESVEFRQGLEIFIQSERSRDDRR